MDTTEEKSEIHKLINTALAEQIGVEPEDIKDTDSFSDDLHMTATNLSDFVESLSTKGLDISKVDLSEINTVHDLVEIFDSQEPIK